MAVTAIGRMRDLLMLMQLKLSENEIVLLTFTGVPGAAAELYILNRLDHTTTSVKTWKTVADLNRWAMGDLEKRMAEFL